MADAFHGTADHAQRGARGMLGRRCYCVSYFRPDQIALVALSIALRVMIDNGAFSAWKKGLMLDAAYWRGVLGVRDHCGCRCPPLGPS
jgi:hypothetical protein